MKRTFQLRKFGAIAALSLLIHAAPIVASNLAILSGIVTTADGRPISGAMVTAFNEARNRKETAFTGPEGRCLAAQLCR